MEKKSSKFSGQIGFVLAAAGSAVGVGNLWRFPYLAAKDGGGLFLVIYLVLVLTFGFTLLTSDIAIGRRTGDDADFVFAVYGDFVLRTKTCRGIIFLCMFLYIFFLSCPPGNISLGSSTHAVRKRTGVAIFFSRSFLTSWKPSSPGSITSDRITSKFSFCAFS